MNIYNYQQHHLFKNKKINNGSLSFEDEDKSN